VTAGETVYIAVVNGDGIRHDLAIPDQGVQTPWVSGKNDTVSVAFTPVASGVYPYFCNFGHRQAGMEGALIVAPVK
jgi:plastocyanin